MTKHFYQLKKLLALILLSGASSAYADVIRCESRAGDVTYTDMQCGDHVKHAQILSVEEPSADAVIVHSPTATNAYTSSQTRSSNWANIYIAPRAAKVDSESVRSARLKLVSLERDSRQLPAYK